MKLVSSLITLALLFVATNSYLFTKKQMDMLKEQNEHFSSVQNLNITETTCNVVDPTPILPPGKTANEFIVRSGYNHLAAKGNSAFGFIFWGAMDAKGDVSKVQNYPTIVWLQGGPGGSSQFGNFGEMGPILPAGNSEFTYKYNPYSWNQHYNMIFIDNPIGTGLSVAEHYNNIPTNQHQVAQDFYQGMDQLYNNKNGCFNQLNLTQQALFISGESYAGKYVPSVSNYILERPQNDIIRKALEKGAIMVGDGFTDPQTIMDVLPQFGYNLAMTNKQETEYVQKQADAGDRAMSSSKFLDAQQYFDNVLDTMTNNSGLQDVYNWGNRDNTPLALDLTRWLNQVSIKTDVFKFPAKLRYASSSSEVYQALSHDFMQTNVVQIVESILAKNYPILYYNGQNDVIVCTPCTETWLDKIQYAGQPKFGQAQFKTWTTTEKKVKKIAGYAKKSANLNFVTINQAGHMVPMDQPLAAYTMINAYVAYALARHQSEDKTIFDQENDIFNIKQEQKHTQIEL